jgi:hypothetical protein
VDPSTDTESIELDRFELVLLKRPMRSVEISNEEMERLQALHIAHLATLTASGDILVAGPFDEQVDPTRSLRVDSKSTSCTSTVRGDNSEESFPSLGKRLI